MDLGVVALCDLDELLRPFGGLSSYLARDIVNTRKRRILLSNQDTGLQTVVKKIQLDPRKPYLRRRHWHIEGRAVRVMVLTTMLAGPIPCEE
jgi:hypothetical protein